MSRRTRTRSAGMILLSALVAVLVAGASPGRRSGPPPAGSRPS